jgi:hypothetical protein
VLRDGRYVLYLIATFIGVAVYVQYLSTLPLDVKAAGLAIFWYAFAVSLNGAVVIAFELLVTKVSQQWPMRVTIALAYALIAAGVAFYALPLSAAVIIVGTLIWTLGEILGGPATLYAAMAGPPHLKADTLAASRSCSASARLPGWFSAARVHHIGHSVCRHRAGRVVARLRPAGRDPRRPERAAHGGAPEHGSRMRCRPGRWAARSRSQPRCDRRAG